MFGVIPPRFRVTTTLFWSQRIGRHWVRFFECFYLISSLCSYTGDDEFDGSERLSHPTAMWEVSHLIEIF